MDIGGRHAYGRPAWALEAGMGMGGRHGYGRLAWTWEIRMDMGGRYRHGRPAWGDTCMVGKVTWARVQTEHGGSSAGSQAAGSMADMWPRYWAGLTVCCGITGPG